MRKTSGRIIEFARRGRAAGLLGALLFGGLFGCNGNDEIVKTTEPRTNSGKPNEVPAVFPKEAPKGEKVPTRTLGVIAKKSDGQSWFFKLMGAPEEVTKQTEAFDKFVASLEFDEKKPKPSWMLPEGWRDLPGSGIRVATILTGPDKGALEISVISLGGDLLSNVNRWRNEVGLPPLKEEELATGVKEITTKSGAKVTQVDVSGMAPKGGAMPPFAKGKK